MLNGLAPPVVTENRRLLFVAPSAYPLGGVATWLDYLLPGLEEQGWEPSLGLVAGKHHDPVRYLAAHPLQRAVSIHNPTDKASAAAGARVGHARAPTDEIETKIDRATAKASRRLERNENADGAKDSPLDLPDPWRRQRRSHGS